MFFNFIDELRAAGIKASFKEHLVLLEALDKAVIEQTPEAFYYLSRTTFVKDEGLLDRFDQVFGKVFKGLIADYAQQPVAVPEEWLKAIAEKYLTPEEMAKVKALGSWDEIMETLKKRLEEQEKRHSGRQQVDGHQRHLAVRSCSGYNPEGIRVGGEGQHGRAIKVWEKREFANLDNTQAIWARATSRSRCAVCAGSPVKVPPKSWTSMPPSRARRKQGWLDVVMRAGAAQCRQGAAVPRCRRLDGSVHQADRGAVQRRHLRVQEPGILLLPQLSLRRACGRTTRRRWSQRTKTWDILHKYGHDYKVIFVGDAAMSPYEISHPGGSVEHMNEEAGATWLQPRGHRPTRRRFGSIRRRRGSGSIPPPTRMVRELLQRRRCTR